MNNANMGNRFGVDSWFLRRFDCREAMTVNKTWRPQGIATTILYFCTFDVYSSGDPSRSSCLEGRPALEFSPGNPSACGCGLDGAACAELWPQFDECARA